MDASFCGAKARRKTGLWSARAARTVDVAMLLQEGPPWGVNCLIETEGLSLCVTRSERFGQTVTDTDGMKWVGVN
jgi:hypothetical protein